MWSVWQPMRLRRRSIQCYYNGGWVEVGCFDDDGLDAPSVIFTRATRACCGHEIEDGTKAPAGVDGCMSDLANDGVEGPRYAKTPTVADRLAWYFESRSAA